MSDSFTAIKIAASQGAGKDKNIMISENLLHLLDIKQMQQLQLFYGKRKAAGRIQTGNVPDDEIHLPEELMKELQLAASSNKLCLKFLPSKQLLYLGPVVALLTDFHKRQADSPHFGSIHSFCEELHQHVSKVGGLFYVFSYKELTNEEVSGYSFTDGKWIYAQQPMPDVIYNRVHSRKLEYETAFQNFREILAEKRIPLFNNRFLSKWEVYRYLSTEEHIHPFLPETRIFSQENLSDFINKYETVFLKPIHGSQGRNIIKLEKARDSFLCQTSQDLPGAPIKKYHASDLFLQLKPMLNNKINIIQQGILLLKDRDRAIDFRALVHKNHAHDWEVTSLVARISAEQQFVSNIAKGGEIMKPGTALFGHFPAKKIELILSLMKELAILAANTISQSSTGLTGELGIDIGVDYTGKPWIIEINSKPSKNFGDSPAKIRPSAKAIIGFCRKLAFDKVLEMEEY